MDNYIKFFYIRFFKIFNSDMILTAKESKKYKKMCKKYLIDYFNGYTRAEYRDITGE